MPQSAAPHRLLRTARAWLGLATLAAVLFGAGAIWIGDVELPSWLGGGQPREGNGVGLLRNELHSASSPYLRSAAEQPVHWQQWSDDLFALAAELDRPIYLDIGAIWCHWCHVMDRESYEDASIAALINANFIPVKVDRDLRPDIDQRYQRAVGALTGTGGWPLTVFLSPSGDVYFGGTYFPPARLREIVPALARAWHEDRERIVETSGSLRRLLEDKVFGGRAGDLSPALIDAVVDDARTRFDAKWGGFGTAPKFPQGNAIELLIWRAFETGDPALERIVTTTLGKMAQGGIRDQLSGRFHRYSTDRPWRLPHFEVMLYDQAEILGNYAQAYALTGDELYRQIAAGIVDFLGSSFSQPQGGFYANQDADISLDDDGSYYTWSLQQLRRAVLPEQAAVLELYYDIGESGEMAGATRAEDPSQNVLWIAATVQQVADQLGQRPEATERLLGSGRAAMLQARQLRQPPQTDRNIYSDWNGMAISALLHTYAALGDAAARDLGLRTLHFLLENATTPDEGVFHSWFEGERHVAGLLDDQVMVARALLDAYEATGEAQYLERAQAITDWTLANLWDEAEGGFFDSVRDASAPGLLAATRKPMQDSPSASGNGVAAQVLTRLYHLTQNPTYHEAARRTLVAFAGQVSDSGIFASALALAAARYLEPPTTVVVVGEIGDPIAEQLQWAGVLAFRPGKILLRLQPDGINLARIPAVVGPVLSAIEPSTGPQGFVCTGAACTAPTRDPQRLASQVREFGLSRSTGRTRPPPSLPSQ